MARAAVGKKFSYYRKLSQAQKRVYDQSDRITSVRLPQAKRFQQCVNDLEQSLERDDRKATKQATERLIFGLCTVFGVPQIRVRVLETRPSRRWGELHGLYTDDGSHRPQVTVWMRTARREQAVAFRTFLRTVLHEFLHHLDFALLKLGESFHTEGFYRRESSLMKALLGETAWPLPTLDLPGSRHLSA